MKQGFPSALAILHYVFVRVLLGVLFIEVVSGCSRLGDPIADHQSEILELRDDGLFVVEGAILRSGNASAERVTARLTGLPPLSVEDVRLIREWMAKSVDEKYVSCAVLPDGTLDILALRAEGKKTMRLHEEIAQLLKQSGKIGR